MAPNSSAVFHIADLISAQYPHVPSTHDSAGSSLDIKPEKIKWHPRKTCALSSGTMTC
jgi:hypothetical protein